MSLTSCLSKAGKNVNVQDKNAIHAAARQYRADGLNPDDAARKAVDEQIAVVRALLEKSKSSLADAKHRLGDAKHRLGDDGLSTYSPDELRQRDESAKEQAKTKASEDSKADAKAKAEREKADIQSRQDASAENFQLGQSADDSLSGQGGLFANSRKKSYSGNHQDDLFNGQLDIFTRSEPDPSQTGLGGEGTRAGVDEARRDAVSALDTLRRARDSILSQSLSSDYAARQRVSLVGQTIASNLDLAVLAQVYRDPRFETFRIVFIGKNNAVVSQLGLTSRMPSSTAAIMGSDTGDYLKTLSATAKHMGATSFYLLHNHPSGNPQPSRADINLTQMFDRYMPGLNFMGHVVIDTNKYSVIHGDGHHGTFEQDFGQSEPFRTAEFSDFKINVPADVLTLAKRLQVDDDAVTLVYLGAQHAVHGIVTVPSSFVVKDFKSLKAAIQKQSLLFYGTGLVAVGKNKSVLRRMNGLILEAVHINPSGAATSLVMQGVVNSGPLPWSDRYARVSPDSGPEYAYLRMQSTLKTAGQRAAEGIVAREDGPSTRGTNDAMTNKDVIGNQDGRSADDSTPGSHRPASVANGSSADDLSAAFGNDIYSPKALQLHGQGMDADKQAIAVIRAMHGKPDAVVTVYRAVPKDGIDQIEPGDWVATTQEYAELHGDGPLSGDFKIIRKSVPARTLFNSGDSIHEFGYQPNETTAPGSGGVLSTSLDAKSFFVSDKRFADGPAGKNTALADAAAVLGMDIAPTVLVQKDFSRLKTPMRYAINGVIHYNTAVPRTRAEDLQFMIEEILHSVDHVGGKNMISASSTRLAPGGDLRQELVDAYDKSAAIKDVLNHPLAEPELHEGEVVAELYARSAMLYHSNPELLRVTAPKTHEAHRRTFSGSSDQNGLPSQVRGLPSSGVQTGESASGGQRVAGGAGAGAGNGRADGLRRLRERIAEVFDGKPEGREITFHDDGNSLNATSNQSAPNNNTWDAPPDTQGDKIIYNLQDGRVDLKRAQEAIAKGTGAPINDNFDARLHETLYMGRVSDRANTFLKVEAKPLIEAMAKNGIGMDELSDYLLARHAPERNAQIAKVNDKMPDGGSGSNSAGVLMTTAAANAHIAALTPGKLLAMQLLARKVDAITQGTKNILVNEGLESKDTIAAWDGAYKNYVPLFKDESEEATYPSHPQGSGFSIKGNTSKRAMGSEKGVTNMLAHVLMQREAAITRAEKNRVGMSLYGLALTQPNSEFWTTIKPSMNAADLEASLQAMGVDPANSAGMDMAPTVRTIDKATGKVVMRPNPMYKNMANAMVIKVDGQDRVIVFNQNSDRAKRLVANLKNLDGVQGLDIAGSVVGKSTRWIASLATQYNPAFGMVNLVRDVGGAMVNLNSTALAGKQGQVFGNIAAAGIGIARDLAGSADRTAWSDLYVQFREDGAQTGYREALQDPFERTKVLEAELQGLSKSGQLTAGKAASAVLGLMDDFNTTLENSTRLAAYKVALDQGMSRPQAAKLARELTVNFNRKGAFGSSIGPLYAFFNAAVQGNARTLVTLMSKHGGKIVAGGVTLGVMQALMLAFAGYDDDEIAEFAKARAFIVPMPGKRYVSIPLPLGLHVLPNTGRIVTELSLAYGRGDDMGNWDKKVFNAVGEIAGAFNPLGGGNVFTAHGLAATVSPTVLDPVVDLATNENFAGQPISKQSFPGDPRPGYLRGRESMERSATGEVYKGIAQAINAMGGGEFKRGYISPTPEEVKYVAMTIGGGLLREIDKIINATVLTAKGEPVPAYMVPLGSRFAGEVDDDQLQRSRYFKNSQKVNALKVELMGLSKSGQDDAANQLEEKNPTVALYKFNDKVNAKLGKLNKQASENISDTALLKEVDAARVEYMRELNTEVRALERASDEEKQVKVRQLASEPATDEEEATTPE